jgi:hypothetical protein
MSLHISDHARPLLSYSPTHILFAIPIHDFLQLPIKNWRFNRPVDKLRSKEIAAYLTKTKQPMETVFYLVKTDKGYEVLDGIHRYTALKMLMEEPVDYITGLVGYSEAEVLVNIRFDASDGTCVDVFKSLNKSIPVPDLYMKDPDQVKRDIVESVVKKWTIRYADHFSPSRKPVRPNMNRDTFIEVVTEIYDKYNTDNNVTIDDMEHLLLECNYIALTQFAEEEKPKSAIEKCKKTGFWLFMMSAEQIVLCA